MNPLNDKIVERALRAYGGALAVADPIRLQFWDTHGITMPQLRLLFFLLEEDGRCAGELAETMRIAASTLTRLCDRLARHGLIIRKEDPDDRRLVRLYLTEEGRRYVTEIGESSRVYFRKVFEQLGRERLARLIECMEELAEAAAQVQAHGGSV